MTEYTSWAKVPEGLKTKNSLIKLGIYKTGGVVAKVRTSSGVYDLYKVDDALAMEKRKGNKMLSIDANNQEDYVIMEMATTGDGASDEIIQLVLLNMSGCVLMNQYFKPMKEISPSAMARHQISPIFLKSMPRWDVVWRRLRELIENKVILIPNSAYGVRIFEQTCKRYNVDLDFQLNCICSRETIQHKFTIMSLFKTPETEIQNPLQDSYETLKMLYPKSPLYVMQAKAKNYFDRLCNFKLRNGDNAAFEKGYEWLKKEFNLSSEELEFDTMDFLTCSDIVENLETPLKGLGLL